MFQSQNIKYANVCGCILAHLTRTSTTLALLGTSLFVMYTKVNNLDNVIKVGTVYTLD